MINEYQGLSLVLISLLSGIGVRRKGKRADEKAIRLQKEVCKQLERQEHLKNGVSLWKQFSEEALLKIQEQDHELKIAEADRARGEKAEAENQHLKTCLKRTRKECAKLKKQLDDLSQEIAAGKENQDLPAAELRLM